MNRVCRYEWHCTRIERENVAFITIASAIAAIQSFHVDVSSSSHFANAVAWTKETEKAIHKQSDRSCSANRNVSAAPREI